jgi:hypothetical protein
MPERSLITWTAVSLIAAKFKPRFGFTLPHAAIIFILAILYGLYLLSV